MRVITLLVIFLAAWPSLATDKELVVAVSPFPPSVIEFPDKSLGGFDVDLWREIAQRGDWAYSFRVVEFQTIFSEVKEQKADVAFAGISMTEERENDVDFSLPYLNASLRIMVPSHTSFDTATTLRSLSNSNVLRALFYLLLFVVICGHIVWFAERGEDAINDNYFPGIFEAFWWACVTMTTVGYGDIAPRNWLGRVIGVVIMFSGIVFFGWFVAALSSALETETLSAKVQSQSDLYRNAIGTKKGTTSDLFLKERNPNLTYFDSVDAAGEALLDQRIDAFVLDKPALEYYVRNKGGDDFVLLDDGFEPQYYGFTFPQGSPLREEVNRILLRMIEDGTYAALMGKYF